MPQEERVNILQNEKISFEEKKNIEDLSYNITKYKEKLHIEKNKLKKGAISYGQ